MTTETDKRWELFRDGHVDAMATAWCRAKRHMVWADEADIPCVECARECVRDAERRVADARRVRDAAPNETCHCEFCDG